MFSKKGSVGGQQTNNSHVLGGKGGDFSSDMGVSNLEVDHMIVGVGQHEGGR